MNIIRTIDLWTEQNPNHIECFSGAFVDGLKMVLFLLTLIKL